MGRGIDAVMYTTKNGQDVILKRNRKPITNWEKPIWVNNISLNEIMEDYDIHNLVMTLHNEGRILCLKAKWFSTSQGLVKVSELYKKRKVLVAFARNKNALRLITVPAQTRKEILTAGQDIDGKYRFPLLLGVDGGRYVSINHCM